jgi:hypothetical protein
MTIKRIQRNRIQKCPMCGRRVRTVDLTGRLVNLLEKNLPMTERGIRQSMRRTKDEISEALIELVGYGVVLQERTSRTFRYSLASDYCSALSRMAADMVPITAEV